MFRELFEKKLQNQSSRDQSIQDLKMRAYKFLKKKTGTKYTQYSGKDLPLNTKGIEVMTALQNGQDISKIERIKDV